MYPVSETFKTYIKRDTVDFAWHGTMVDTEGNSYTLTEENIVQSSGKISQGGNTEELSIGKSWSAELQINLFLDVDRYLLFGATITLYFTLYMGNDTEDVPMGIFTVAECTQSNGQLHIIAYDNMPKFDDVKVSMASLTDIQSPLTWLNQMCTACGVVLGSTNISSLPNANRNTGLADVTTDIQTWRDILNYLCAYLGSFAYIGRDGKLYLGQYTSNAIDTITPSFRYSSNLSDYKTTYDGIYGTCKESGVQEYVDNENTGGLVLDLGTNPFLQFTEQSNRLAALQEIIDAWNGVYYVPYDSTTPIIPYYDLGDVLRFTGNQAGEYDIGAITEIVYAIGGRMTLKCSGDNPRLASAQDRFTKTIAGLAKEYNNGQEVGNKEFWILSTTNTDTMTIGSTETQIAEIEYDQKTFGQSLEMIVTIDTVLSNTAIVNIRVIVDDDTDLEMNVTESKSLNGKRFYQCSNPQKIYGKGVHTCKVYMTVTDSPILWSELK